MRRRYLVAALVVGGLAVAGVLLALAVDEKPEPVAETEPPSARLPSVATSLDLLPWRCGELVYQGDGSPDVAVVFEAPVLAANQELEQEYTALPLLVMEANGWRAGDKRVGVFTCDNTTFPGGSLDPDPPSCGDNAKAFAREPSVVLQVQSGNSGCAAVQLIVVGGDLPLVSAGGTYDCLTRAAEACEETEPTKYQPGGVRSFAHLLAADRVQAAALAEFAASEGLRRVYVLDDREAYGVGIARHFVNAAPAAGLEIAGEGSWDPKADSYRDLMRQIEATKPDAILLAGLLDENGTQVIHDKVAVLGPNAGPVRLLASDGFGGAPTLEEVGPRAEGLFVASAGLPLSELPAQGRDLIDALEAETSGPLEPDQALRLVYAAAALEVGLAAIASSDGTRAGVLDTIFETEIEDGYAGPVGFDLYGDPTTRPVRIERVESGQWVPYRTIEPDDALVQAVSD